MMNKHIKIIPFGSGSTGNSMYIEIENHRILVDMGIGMRKIKQALEKHSRSLNDIEAIFITHDHYDHIKNAPAIINNTKALVYCNEETSEYMKNKNIDYCLLSLNNKKEVLEGLFVEAFKVPHDRYVYGYLFEVGNTRLAYVTDCGTMNNKIFNYLKKADVVIIESNHDLDMLENGPYDYYLKRRIRSKNGHLSNADCATTIKKLNDLGINNFLLAHLSRENNRPEIALNETLKALDNKQVNIYVCPVESDELLEYRISDSI